jgi:hypothetical protein
VAEDFQLKLNLLYIMIVRKSHHINEDTNFDNVDGPKLSFEEINLSDSIFNGVIKYYKMTADQYKDILSKVKLNRTEMLFHSEDSKGIEYYSTNFEIDDVVNDEEKVVHGVIEDEVDKDDKFKYSNNKKPGDLSKVG